ncbi:MAG: WD40 repeat domain-containing protein [Planctomycetaceae bacterium]
MGRTMGLIRFLLSASLLLCFGGCGGEDLSQPPAEIQACLAKQKARAGETQGGSAKTGQSETPQGSSAVVTPPAKGTSEAASEGPTLLTQLSSQPVEPPASADSSIPESGSSPVDGSAQTMTSVPPASEVGGAQPSKGTTGSTPPATAAPATAAVESGSEKTDKPSPQNKDTAAQAEGVITAGGKTQSDLKEEQKTNETVAAAGMSLLDKLKVSDEKKTKPAGRQSTAKQVITRTGRFAIAAEAWLKLRNQLAKRFYVASNEDGSRIAASSGQRSLGVLSTQVVSLGKERVFTRTTNNVLAVEREKKEVTTQSVTGLPGVISCIELDPTGDVVLVGTRDGRLLARSCANLQTWDIYAQDLFAFQDERRPSTKIADSAVTTVRQLTDQRILTITDDGIGRIWKTNDVVHRPLSPLEMTEEQARSPEAPVLTAEPLCPVELPKSRVLNLFLSASGKLAAVVTADEIITVFQTEDGTVTDSVTAAQLNDTQPVSGIFEEDLKRIVVGLADGRIFRRALTGGEPVKGTDENGIETDYEILFAPDLGDNSGPITALQTNQERTLLYIGRLDGSVTRFDLPRKQLQRSDKLHAGPVLDIRCTQSGVFTVGDDRSAKLIDVPGTTSAGASETFDLPKDKALNETVVIEPDDEIVNDKFTRARNFNNAVTDADGPDLSLLGIRPADPVLALYEHQLRVAVDPERRAEIRSRIEQTKASIVPADETGSINPETAELTAAKPMVSENPPEKFAEFSTEFDFKSRPLRRVVMSLSTDGTTLAASQYYRSSLIRGPAPDQPVYVWDTLTDTRLRTWKRSKGIFELTLQLAEGLVLPKPFTARLSLFDGSFQTEPSGALCSQISSDGQRLAIGLSGLRGAATPAVAVRAVESAQFQTGIEAFEGGAPAIAWGPGDESLFVSVRDRTQSHLLELDSVTLSVKSEILHEPMPASWNVDNPDFSRDTLGAINVLPSPSGQLLATYGRFDAQKIPFQLRIWKRKKDTWPLDQAKTIPSAEPLLEPVMTDTPMVFVHQQDTSLAVISTKGVAVVSTRTGEVEQTLALPDIAANSEKRRPVTLLSPDGKWVIGGDNDGYVWIWSLRSLDGKPLVFAAQAGPITGLAMTTNSVFLATAGEENRIRVWKMTEFLNQKPRSGKR